MVSLRHTPPVIILGWMLLALASGILLVSAMNNWRNVSIFRSELAAMDQAVNEKHFFADFRLPERHVVTQHTFGGAESFRAVPARELFFFHDGDNSCPKCAITMDAWLKLVENGIWNDRDRITLVRFDSKATSPTFLKALETSGAMARVLMVDSPNLFALNSGLLGLPVTMLLGEGGQVERIVTGTIDWPTFATLELVLRERIPSESGSAYLSRGPLDLVGTSAELFGASLKLAEDCDSIDHDSLELLDKGDAGWALGSPGRNTTVPRQRR